MIQFIFNHVFGKLDKPKAKQKSTPMLKTLDIDQIAENDKKLAENFICPICLSIPFPKHAYKCNTCEQIFCNECYKQVNTCPMKCEKKNFIVTNICRTERNILNNMIVTCPLLCDTIIQYEFLEDHCENQCINREVICDFCESPFKHKELENHEIECKDVIDTCPFENCSEKATRLELKSHKKECSYQDVECTNEGCNLTISLSEFENHINNECPFRIVKCPNKGCKVKLCHNQVKSHKEDCLFRIMICPNQCDNQFVPFHNLDHHMFNECPYRIVSCQNRGCPAKKQYNEMEDHMSSCDFRIINCECNKSLQFREMKKHLIFDCTHRIVQCTNENCGKQMPFFKLADHFQECTYRLRANGNGFFKKGFAPFVPPRKNY